MKKPVSIISIDDFSGELNGYLQSDFHERLKALFELNNCIIENGIIDIRVFNEIAERKQSTQTKISL